LVSEKSRPERVVDIEVASRVQHRRTLHNDRGRYRERLTGLAVPGILKIASHHRTAGFFIRISYGSCALICDDFFLIPNRKSVTKNGWIGADIDGEWLFFWYPDIKHIRGTVDIMSVVSLVNKVSAF